MGSRAILNLKIDSGELSLVRRSGKRSLKINLVVPCEATASFQAKKILLKIFVISNPFCPLFRLSISWIPHRLRLRLRGRGSQRNPRSIPISGRRSSDDSEQKSRLLLHQEKGPYFSRGGKILPFSLWSVRKRSVSTFQFFFSFPRSGGGGGKKIPIPSVSAFSSSYPLNGKASHTVRGHKWVKI